MANVFSLTTVSAIITNPVYGQLTIGGAGKLVGQISYNFSNDAFTLEGSPTGGYSANYSDDRSGGVSINIRQTSSHIPQLTDFINWCRQNPTQAASTIKIVDTLGNIAMSGNGVFPKGIPGNTAGEKAGDRGFEFVVGEIFAEEV